MAGLQQLVFVDDEILVEYGDSHSAAACCGDEGIGTTEEMTVGENTDGCGTLLLIAQGNDGSIALFLDPALGGRLALELCNDARWR